MPVHIEQAEEFSDDDRLDPFLQPDVVDGADAELHSLGATGIQVGRHGGLMATDHVADAGPYIPPHRSDRRRASLSALTTRSCGGRCSPCC